MKFTILIFCFTLLSSQLTEATTGTPVLDVDGDEVRPGGHYYVVPTMWGSGGGLTLRGRNKTCPLTVAQEPYEVNPGLRLRFHPIDPKAKFVTLNTDMNVAFKLWTPSICSESTVWKLRADKWTTTVLVGVGGKIGNHGPGTLANWFKIEKGEHLPGYKFVFDPDVDVGHEIITGDLGILYQNGGQWLGLGGSQITFQIMKA